MGHRRRNLVRLAGIDPNSPAAYEPPAKPLAFAPRGCCTAAFLRRRSTNFLRALTHAKAGPRLTACTKWQSDDFGALHTANW